MALRGFEGGEGATAAQLLQGRLSAYSSLTVTTAAARFVGNGLRIPNFGTFDKAFNAQATWINGFAWRCAALPTSDLTWKVARLLDGATVHLELLCDTAGRLVVKRGDGTQLGITSGPVITPLAYNHIQIKATIDNATGAVTVRLNDTDVITITGADTRNGGNSTADTFRYGGGGFEGINLDYDDMYWCDGTGGVDDDFLGDYLVEAILPSGNGAHSDFDGSDGNSVNNSLLVDEATPNDDTDYVESLTVGDIDTYAFANLGTVTGAIKAVRVNLWARKTDAGARSINPVIRTGGSDFDGSALALIATYQFVSEIFLENPDTTAAWTISEVNAAEFGVKVAA